MRWTQKKGEMDRGRRKEEGPSKYATWAGTKREGGGKRTNGGTDLIEQTRSQSSSSSSQMMRIQRRRRSKTLTQPVSRRTHHEAEF